MPAVQPGATYSVCTDDAFLLGILLYDGLFGGKKQVEFSEQHFETWNILLLP